MNEKELLAAVDELALAKYGRPLNNDQRIILRGSYQGKSYKEIYKDHKDRLERHCELNTFERSTAYKFWKFLSELLDVKVSKNNFIGAVERAWRLKNEEPFDADNIEDKGQSSFSPDSKVEIERENDTSTELLPIDWSEENYSRLADKQQLIDSYTLVMQSKPEKHMNDNEKLDNNLMMPVGDSGVKSQELLDGIEVTGNLEAEDLVQKAKPSGSVKQKMATNLKAENVKLGNLTQEC